MTCSLPAARPRPTTCERRVQNIAGRGVSYGRRVFLRRLGLGAAGLTAMSSVFVKALARQSPTRGSLPGSSPETQGVSSAAILRFLDAAAASTHEFHSLMIVRHGHVIAAGWWAPYRPDAVHMLYSLTKSFTSTAVGFAVAEGRLSVQDPVTKFFPEALPPIIGDNLAALRIEHLLTMSAGHATETNATITTEHDWAKAFLALPIERAPGSVFLYDSGASYMLAAIVQKLCGEKLIDYLTPRLFSPLGMHGMTWETCPLGRNIGGWGLSVTTETLASFGQFCLQQGQWNGTQLLPREWLERATTARIQQPPDSKEGPNSDWNQGYGYQFWRCRHHGFRGDGAFGQSCIVMPDQDAVIAITSCTRDMQGLFNLVWEHLLPAMSASLTKRAADADAKLMQRLASLALPLPAGAATSPLAAMISGKRYRLEPNSLGATDVAFDLTRASCTFRMNGSEVHCGVGNWQYGTTNMPGTPPRIREPSGPMPARLPVAAASAWKDDHTLEMHWRFYETPHYDTVTCRFDGNQITVEFLNSITQLSRHSPQPQPETRPVLRGSFAS
jgi:CubicO group peptidase (beta-lactamase class C family)